MIEESNLWDGDMKGGRLDCEDCAEVSPEV